MSCPQLANVPRSARCQLVGPAAGAGHISLGFFAAGHNPGYASRQRIDKRGLTRLGFRWHGLERWTPSIREAGPGSTNAYIEKLVRFWLDLVVIARDWFHGLLAGAVAPPRHRQAERGLSAPAEPTRPPPFPWRARLTFQGDRSWKVLHVIHRAETWVAAEPASLRSILPAQHPA